MKVLSKYLGKEIALKLESLTKSHTLRYWNLQLVQPTLEQEDLLAPQVIQHFSEV